MNGELAQLSALVMSARKARQSGEDIHLNQDPYVISIKFKFAPRGRLIKRQDNADSISAWYQLCQKNRLEEIQLITPSEVKDRHLLGFANVGRGAIVCHWQDGMVTYFIGRWEFDNVQKGWNVVYEEWVWEDAPRKIPVVKDETEAFKQVLLDIEKFARDIGFENFANIFHRAYEALNGNFTTNGKDLPDYIPVEFRGIYYAVVEADVFGAMGSWNDSPPYYAHEKGLEKEYDALSDALLKQLRKNLMFITNECWKISSGRKKK